MGSALGRMAVLLTALLLSCGLYFGQEAPSPAGSQWERISPEQAGLDGQALDAIAARMRQGEFGNAHAWLLAKDGKLVVEEYFQGYRPERRHTIQSISKSITSLLIGIAIGQGKIRGVEQKVLEFFPDIRPRHLDQFKREMALEDLLTMRTGFDWDEQSTSLYDRSNPLGRLNRLGDGWNEYVLDFPLKHPPGTVFEYNSGASILLGGILKQATGMHAEQYARRELFGPMGISDFEWESNRSGYNHTGGGLDMRPADLLKIGQLMLDEGMWRGEQLVPREWVRASVERHVEKADHDLGYGYQWWLLPPSRAEGLPDLKIICGLGMGGQYLLIVPDRRLVLLSQSWHPGRQTENNPIRLLYREILPLADRSAEKGGQGKAQSAASADRKSAG